MTNGSGTVGNANVTNVQVNCHPSQAVVTTMAGSGTAGHANSLDPLQATFTQPSAVAMDSAGNLYVADLGSNQIRRIDKTTGEVTLWAGDSNGVIGNTDGVGAAARLGSIYGMAFGPNGYLYVAQYNDCVIRRISPTQVVEYYAGVAGSCTVADGSRTTATFGKPNSLSFDPAGNMFVAEWDSGALRKIDLNGNVSTLGAFVTLGDVAVDQNSNLYVTDYDAFRVYKLDSAGTVLATYGSGAPGNLDGPAATATFNRPQYLTIDAAGYLYVSEDTNNLIRRISPNGDVSTLAGSGTAASVDDTGTAASFAVPYGLTMDAYGRIYVAEISANKIRKITPQ